MVGVIDCLVKKLEGRFHAHWVMDISLGVVYPQYWLQIDEEASFAKHLLVIKITYCHSKKMGNYDVWVPRMLLVVALDIEQYMFKLSMKSHAIDAMAKPNDVNLVSRLLR
jgi:hypothetical protein